MSEPFILGMMALAVISFWGTWWLMHPDHSAERMAFFGRSARTDCPNCGQRMSDCLNARATCPPRPAAPSKSPNPFTRKCSWCGKSGAYFLGKSWEPLCINCSAKTHGTGCDCDPCKRQKLRNEARAAKRAIKKSRPVEDWRTVIRECEKIERYLGREVEKLEAEAGKLAPFMPQTTKRRPRSNPGEHRALRGRSLLCGQLG